MYDRFKFNKKGEAIMSEQNFLQKLKKSDKDKCISGVCGGLGETTPIPTWCWRAFIVLTSLFWGFGIVVYIVLAIFMPKK